MPSNDHTTTSSNRAMVPTNLRLRMVMAEMCGLLRPAQRARGEGRAIRGAKIHSSQRSHTSLGMTSISAQRTPEKRAVRWWLASVALLIVIMVLVGGAARLTGYGLAVVDWD